MSDKETMRFDQLKNVGSFLPETRRRVGEVGLALAMAEEFEKANIHITAEGDTASWIDEGQPAIAVGDHSKGLECLLILAASGVVGRHDISITAKPYALTGQVANALSCDEDDYLIGLVPGNMAKDRKGGDFGTRIHRAAFRHQLTDKQGIREYNERSMQRAASLIEDDGRLVTIFPTGGVYDAAKAPWRNGVGQLASRLSPETFDTTVVAPFMFEGINARRILLAMMKGKMGLKPKRQDITATFGKGETLGAIFHDIEEPTPAEVTQRLQARYQEELGV